LVDRVNQNWNDAMRISRTSEEGWARTLERAALKDWRNAGEAGNVGRLMKGVCHGPFSGEVDTAEAVAI
jgi:hypothetical protein